MEDRDDRDDEKPVVVVLADGDLTAAEVESEMKSEEDLAAHPAAGTKIMFKKPTKRISKDSNNSEEVTKPKKSKKSKKDKSLLSFDEDEEDQNDSSWDIILMHTYFVLKPYSYLMYNLHGIPIRK